MGAEPKRGARWSCGEAFVCCLSRGESVLSGPRIGTARLKAEKRKKEKYTSACKAVSSILGSCFDHYPKLNPERAYSIFPVGIHHLRGSVTEIEECTLPKCMQTVAPLAFSCWDLFVCFVVICRGSYHLCVCVWRFRFALGKWKLGGGVSESTHTYPSHQETDTRQTRSG